MRKERRLPAQTVTYLLLVICTVLVLLPVLYTLGNSFMSASEINRYYGRINLPGKQTLFHIFPDQFYMNAYYQILFRRSNYLIKFWNSLVYSFLIVGGQVIISCLAGYAFARFRFPGRDALFFLVIILMMMPYQVTLVPNYIVLDRMRLLGNWAAVILPAVFSPFGVFIMRQSAVSIPNEILESAQLDGANQGRSLFRIVVPMCKGGLFSLVILSFIDTWNMVEQPLVFLERQSQYPLSIFLSQMNAAAPELGFACGILAMLPVVLLFCYFEREMVEGITISSLK